MPVCDCWKKIPRSRLLEPRFVLVDAEIRSTLISALLTPGTPPKSSRNTARWSSGSPPFPKVPMKASPAPNRVGSNEALGGRPPFAQSCSTWLRVATVNPSIRAKLLALNLSTLNEIVSLPSGLVVRLMFSQMRLV